MQTPSTPPSPIPSPPDTPPLPPSPTPQTSISFSSAAGSLHSLTRCLPLVLLLFLTTPPPLLSSPRAPHLFIPSNPVPLKLETNQSVAIPPNASFYFNISNIPTNTTQTPRPTAYLLDVLITRTVLQVCPLLLAAPSLSTTEKFKPPPLYFASHEKPSRLSDMTGDFEGFWTRARYHFVVLSPQNWIVTLHNCNRTTANLHATIRLRGIYEQKGESGIGGGRLSSDKGSDKWVCPTGPGRFACSGRGVCNAPSPKPSKRGNGKGITGQCECRSSAIGRYCEASPRVLSPVPRTSDEGHKKLMVYRSAARVRPNDAAFFSISVPQNGSLAVQMHISTPSRTPTRPFSQPVMVVKQLNENGGIRLIKGPTVPSLYDWRFVDRSSVLGRLPMQTIVRGAVKRGQVMYIGVYNVPRMGWSVGLGKRLFVPGVVGVRIESFLCGQDGIVCPVGGAWEPGVGVLVLPLLMGVLTMLTMVVCVSVWAGVFRRQVDTIRTDERRDALTQTEVEAMFPPFEYTKRETVALGATGDVCCCVCLCGFEEGERLRRLACGHSYHAMCLDQWLVTNATCPRCRKAARISGELGGGWRTSIVGSLRRIVDRIGHLGGRDDPEGVGEELLATEEGRDDR